MSRRNDLLQQLLASDKFGDEKEKEQRFLQATAELILTDLINVAINGFSAYGAGTLMINLINDSTTYMSGHDIERDICAAERNEDDTVVEFLRELMTKIDNNDWTESVLITLISDAGTRTFSLEAGRSQESFSEAAHKSKE